MLKPILKLLGALVFSVLAIYFVMVQTGNVIVAGACLALLGVLLPLPILEVISAFRQRSKDLYYRNLNGRHYAFRTQSIEVDETDDHDRWIRIASIRAVLENLPANPVLKRIFQDQMIDGPAASIHVDALIDYLRRAHDHRAIQFKLWLEREVSLPAQNRKTHRSRTA